MLDLLINYRWRFFISSMLLLIFSVTSICSYLETDFGSEGGTDNSPKGIEFTEIDSVFPEYSAQVLFIKFDGDLFQPANLELIRKLQLELRKMPYAQGVISLASHIETRAQNDEITTEYLIPPKGLITEKIVHKVKQVANNDEDIKGILVSLDSTTAAFHVRYAFPDKEYEKANAAILDYAKEISKEISNKNNVDRSYWLGKLSRHEVFTQVNAWNLKVVLPIAVLCTILVMALILRNLLISFVSVLIVVVFSELVALGIFGLLGWTVSQFVIMGMLTIVLIASADIIHLLTQYIINARNGANSLPAMRASLEHNLKPITMTTITTMTAFFSLNFVEADNVKLMGNIAAFGSLAAWLSTMTLMPALITALNIKFKSKPLSISLHMKYLYKFIRRWDKAIVVSFLLIILWAASGLGLNEIDQRVNNGFSDRQQYQRDQDYVKDNFKVLQNIIYRFNSQKEYGIMSPAFLQKVDAFKIWLLKQNGVSNVKSYVDTLKMINYRLHNDDLAAKKLPSSEEEASQYSLIYEFSLPVGEHPTNVNFDYSQLKLVAGVKQESMKELLLLDQKADQWLAENEIETIGTGNHLLGANILLKAVSQMAVGVLTIMLVISVFMIISLRSFKYAIIALIPNLFPAVVVYGIWGYLIGDIGLIEIILLSISLGIIVDDSTHFLVTYLKHKRSGLNTTASVKLTLQYTGTALLTTTFAFVFGMMAFLVSDFNYTQAIALILAPILLTALILDLLLLPAVLFLVDGRKAPFWVKAKQ